MVDALEPRVADAMEKVCHQARRADFIVHHQDVRFFQRRFVHVERLSQGRDNLRPPLPAERDGQLRRGGAPVPQALLEISSLRSPSDWFPPPHG